MESIPQDANSGLLNIEFQRSFNWDVLLPAIDNGPSPEEVALSIQDVKFGGYNFVDAFTLRYGAYRSKSSGQLGIEDVSIVFLNPISYIVPDYLRAWRELIVSWEGFYHSKSNYAKQIICKQYDRRGAQVAEYLLVNAWPKNLPGFDLGYDKNRFVSFNIPFSVDRVDKL